MRVHLLGPSIPWRDGQVTVCGRKIQPGIVEAVDPNVYRNRPRTDKCRSCEFSLFGALKDGRHWVQGVKNALIRVSNGNQDPIVLELEAIKELVERHRGEFDSLRDALQAEATIQAEATGNGWIGIFPPLTGMAVEE